MEVTFSIGNRRFWGWRILLFAGLIILTAPILSLGLGVFQENDQVLNLTSQKLLPLYVQNTLIILLGTSILTLLVGIFPAWLVSVAKFPFSRQLEWLLILPLSIPTFINAIAYVGLTDYAGPIRTLLRKTPILPDIYMDLMNHIGVIWVMSMVLYPYVYLTARTAFIGQSANMIEAASSLGVGRFSTFLRVVLPISWPAIFSGLSLVIMETLNDYGTVHYYGVPTFTTGIFRSWLSLGNLPAAILLSLVLLGFVLVLLSIEEYYKGRRRFVEDRSVRLLTKRRILGYKKWIALLICLVPLIFGFIVPVFQIIYWLVSIFDRVDWLSFWSILLNTFQLATGSCLLIITFGLIIAYSNRILHLQGIAKYLQKIALLGYATPGAVIGVGMILLVVSLNPSWLYLGISALIYGYLVRFFAVGYNPIEAAFKKQSHSLDEAGISLGLTTSKVLTNILLPLIKPGLLAAAIMVFVDVSKELPLTLILRPFNFETLATNAFQYAKDELAAQSAPASLLIILLGILPAYFLNKTMRNLG